MLEIKKLEIDGRSMWVTIQSDSIEEIHSLQARQMAYDERIKHGFTEAGIESYGGAYPMDKTKAELPNSAKEIQELGLHPERLAYQKVFKLTRAL